MEYRFFDKRFLLAPGEEDEHVGDKVFYADGWNELVSDVEKGDTLRMSVLLSVNVFRDFPFEVIGSQWRFAYCDPNYECKVAYSQGKKIQFMASSGEWEDVNDKPLWCSRDVYRVKPKGTETRRYTNRELSEWVANNRGQILKNRMVSVSYYYLEGSDDAPVPGNVKIRAWSESEWHEPLVEVKE